MLLFKKHEWFNCALKQVLNCLVQRCILEVLLHKAIFFNSSCNFTAAGLLSLVPRVRGRKNGIESLQRVHLKQQGLELFHLLAVINQFSVDGKNCKRQRKAGVEKSPFFTFETKKQTKLSDRSMIEQVITNNQSNARAVMVKERAHCICIITIIMISYIIEFSGM